MSSSRPKRNQQRFAPYGRAPRWQSQRAKTNSRFPPLLSVRHPIRLLELHASYAQPGRAIDIRCSLESYDLDYCPRYRALSYTWGNPFPEDDDSSGVKDWSSPVRPIFLNGRYVYLRQNLYDALHELVRRRWTGFYWIDSMCINQHNLSERTNQVATMGMIFSGASEVVCWLGRADSHLENVLELHRRLRISIDNLGFKVVAPLAPTTFDQIFCAHTRGPPIYSDSFRPTEALCSSYMAFERRRYFGRLWVAQEVALARRLVALCGEKLLEWSAMRDVAEHAFAASKSISWGAYYNSRRKADHIPGRGIRDMGQLRDNQRRNNGDFTLLDGRKATPEEENHIFLLFTLNDTRFLQASDPRDKIYGILGLISRLHPHIRGPRIVIDYKTSVVKLFTQVATELIMGLPYLSLLIGTYSREHQPRKGLPSWVPDYNEIGSLDRGMGKFRHRAGILQGGYSIREVNDNQLILAGHMLDTISRIWHISTSIDHSWHVTDILGLCSISEPSHLQPDRIGSYFKIISRCNSSMCQHLTEQEAVMFRAHILSTLAECARRGDQDQIKMLKESLENFRQTDYGRNVPSSEEVDTWSDAALLNDVDKVDLNRTQRLANEFSEDVNFCGVASTEGHLIVGMRVLCQPGDQIWIIRDSQAPIILRPVPNSTNFTLVGEAYVDGVMYGEALEAEDCPEPVHITIV